MLRVDRGNNRQISIKVRDHKRSLSPLLCNAFLVAVSLHFLIWILFPIHQWVQYPSKRIAPTTLSLYQGAIQTDIQPDVASRATLDWPVWKEAFAFSENTIFLDDDVLENENRFHSDSKTLTLVDDYYPHFTLKTLYPKQVYKKIKLVISGPLADLKVVSLDKRLESTASVEGLNPTHIFFKFHVLVEGKTGKIFWFDWINQSEETDYSRLASEILQQLTFQVNTVGDIEGVIELTILKI